jgi:hypothetical protein
LLALKLDGFAVIQQLVTFCLNGGKMDEDIFSVGPQDETVSFGSIEPLYDALLSHDLSPVFVMGPDLSRMPMTARQSVRENNSEVTPRAPSAHLDGALRQLGVLAGE